MDEPHNLHPTSLSFLTKGSLVEVSSDEDGLNGAWFVATVIHPPPAISSQNHPTRNNLVYVEYHNLLSEDGSSRHLREYANISYVRPSPPPDTNPPKFELNDLVDAFYRDGWWTGVITTVVDTSNFVVTFENPPDRLQFHISELRCHRKWVGGRWVQPQKQETAGLLFTVGKNVEVSLKGESFRDVWFPATILKNSGNNSFLVKYLQPGTGDEAVLSEATVDYLHIRPSPPYLSTNFVLLEKVDAYYDGGWWSGVITKELADNRYNVFFKNTKKEREFVCSNVRPHMEWKGGKWFSTSQSDTDGNTTRYLTEKLIEQTTPSIDKQSTVTTSVMKRTKPKNLDSNDKGSLPSGEIKLANPSRKPNTSSGGQSEELDSEASAMDDQASGKTENLSHGKRVGRRVSLLQRSKLRKGTELKTPTTNSSRKRGRLANELKSLQAVGKGAKVDSVTKRTQETVEKEDVIKDVDSPVDMGLHCNGETVSHEKINEKLSSEGISNVAQGETKQPVVPLTVVDKEGNEGDAAAASVAPKRKRGRPPRLQSVSPKTPVTVDHQNGGVAQLEEIALPTNLITKSLEESQEPVNEQQQGLGEQNENALFTKKLPNENRARASNVRRGRKKYSIMRGKRGRRRTISINTEPQDSQDLSKETPPSNPEASVGKSASTVSDDQPLSRWFEGKHPSVTALGPEGSIGQSSKASERGPGTVTSDMDLPFVKSTPLWQTIESMEVFQKIPQKPHFRPLFKVVKESAREGLAIGTMVTFSTVVEKTHGLTFGGSRSEIEDCLETLVDLENYGFEVSLIRKRLTGMLLIKDKQEELEERSKGIMEKLKEHRVQEDASNEEIEEIDRQIKELEEKRKQALLKKEKSNLDIDDMKAASEEIEREMREVGEEFDRLAATPL